MRLYNLKSKKLDPNTISGYFFGYCLGSRASKFYCPQHTTIVIETDRAIHVEDDTGTSQGPREIVFKEHLVFIHVPIASPPITGHVVGQHLIATLDNEPIKELEQESLDVVMAIPLRRLERVHRPTILDDYIVYL